MADVNTSKTIFELMGLPAPAPAPEVVTAPVVEQDAPSPDKKPRGRPRLNRRTPEQADDAAQAPVVEAPVVEAPVVEAPVVEDPSLPPAPARPSIVAPARIEVLFVDCLPDGAVSSFSQVVQEANSLLGGDYRLGKENEFGRGAGRFLNAVKQVLNGAVVGALFVDSRTPEAAICLDTLRSYSRARVQGVR